VALLRREAGQAAVEFFFVMVGVFLIAGLLVVLFAFAQGVFFENTRARAELFKDFHDDVQFRVGGDKIYKLKNEISVRLKKVPYLEKLIGDQEFKRTLTLRGGTAPTLFRFWNAAVECAAEALLVQQLTPVNTGIPPRWMGDEIGSGAALLICESYHLGEFPVW
jgi:hypothetical protein